MLGTRVETILVLFSESSNLKWLFNHSYQLLSNRGTFSETPEISGELRHFPFEENLFKLLWRMCRKS